MKIHAPDVRSAARPDSSRLIDDDAKYQAGHVDTGVDRVKRVRTGRRACELRIAGEDVERDVTMEEPVSGPVGAPHHIHGVTATEILGDGEPRLRGRKQCRLAVHVITGNKTCRCIG